MGQTLKMNPAYTCVAVNKNRLHIRAGPWSGPIYHIEDTDADGILGMIAEKLTGTFSVNELLDGFTNEQCEQILSVLNELRDENFVLDTEASLTSAETTGYVSIADQFSETAFDRLENDQLLVINFGAIGQMVVDDIVRCGVQQINYIAGSQEDNLSIPELDGVEGYGLDDIELLIEASDFVIYTEDEPHPNVTRRVNERCAETGTEWTSGRVIGFDGFVGPTVVPGETACYNCFRQRMFANIESPDAYEAMMNVEPSRSIVPSFARIVAGELTLDVLNHLTNGRAFSLGRIIHHDFRNLSVESNDVLRLPRCDVCQEIPDGLGHQEHVTMDQIVEEVLEND